MNVNPQDHKFPVLTPKGTASFPRLNTPIKWVNSKCVVSTPDDADASYEIEVLLTAEEAAPIVAKAQAALDEFKAEVVAEFAAGTPAQKKKAREIVVNGIGKPDLDNEGNETGKVKIKFKMKAAYVSKKDGQLHMRKPVLFDAKSKAPLKDAPKVGGGSIVRVAGSAQPYYMANGNAVGVTFYLDAVQIIELREFGGRDADAFGFGSEEGYTAAASKPATPFDDGDAEGATDAPAGDDDF